ncbi:nicotinate-nicotinamide nucleotide adenylyltransferase [Nitratifractor sp.]
MVNHDRKTALFGGSFDPPHLGHTQIIRRTLALDAVDRVVVVPAWLNPFKRQSHADPRLRLEWCRRVFDLPSVVIDDYEIAQGRRVYTVETYRALRKRYDIGWIVVGSDNVAQLPRWRAFETLNRELGWIVATRKGWEADLSALRRAVVVEVDVPVSSTMIRRGEGLEYVDPRIRDEVIETYRLKPNEKTRNEGEHRS